MIKIAHVIQATAEVTGIPVDKLVAVGRKAPVAFARQMAVTAARELTDKTLAQIGQRFGGRDHSSVHHAINVTRWRILSFPEVAEQYERVKARAAELAAGDTPVAVGAVQAPPMPALPPLVKPRLDAFQDA